jgi:hypothetical protein
MDARPTVGSHRQLEQLSGWLRGFWRARRAAVGVFLLYTGITVLMTWPLVPQLSSAIAGDGGDAVEHLWSLWWGKKAMLDLKTSMANLTYFYHPFGAYHPMLSATPMVQIVELPLALLFKPLVAYNLTLLSGFVLTAFTTYVLCYTITKDRSAAFVGGLIFGFAPTRSIHGFGHLAQTITYWFPLYALFVLKLMRHPSWKNALGAGLLLGISALVNFVHTAYFVLIFTLFWLIYFFVAHRHRFLSPRFLRAVAIMLLVAFCLTLPFFVPFMLALFSGRVEYETAGGVIAFSNNPFSFVVPSARHPLVETLGVSSTFVDLLGRFDVETLAYVGLLPLVLAIWGVLRNRSAARFWWLFAVITAVFSMGPLLKLGGEPVVLDVVEGRKIFLPLPYLLFRALPFFGMGRTPARIAGGTPLALAVLVSLGMVQVRKWQKLRRPRAFWPIVGVISAVILFEYCVILPYPTVKLPSPAFYEQVRAEDGDFAIFDYPMTLYQGAFFHKFNRPMFYQTIHERPINGGQIWRLPVEGKRTLLMLDGLITPQDQIRPDIIHTERTATERVGWLSRLNFRYLVLHKKYPGNMAETKRSPDLIEAERSYFSGWLSAPVYEDQEIIAFQIPVADDVGGVPLTSLGSGWHRVEGTLPWRWMQQEGHIDAYALTAGTFRLEFDAQAFEPPRQVSLVVNDQPVYTATVHSKRRFVTPMFTLEPGLSEIVFKAVEPCTRPIDVRAESTDQRCLSVAFSEVKIVAGEQ